MEKGVKLINSKFYKIISYLVASILILALSFGFSIILYVWLDYPRGNDAVSHLFRTQFVVDFFPNIGWVYTWAGGMPMFATYPSASYIILAAIHAITNLSVATVLNGTAVFWGVGVAAIGIFLIATKVGKSWLGGLTAAVIYLSSPSVWNLAFSGGLYSRALAVPFLVFAVWAVVGVLFAEKVKTKDRFMILTVVFLSLCLLFHYTVGAVAILSIVSIYIFANISFRNKASGLVKIFLQAFLVAAPLIVSLIVYGSSSDNLKESNFLGRQRLLLVPISRIFNLFNQNRPQLFLTPEHWIRLSPFLLPLLLFLLVLLYIKKRQIEKKVWRLILAFTVLSVIWLVYSIIVIPLFSPAYYTLGGPVIGMTYLPIFASLVIGILMGSFFSKKVAGYSLSLLVILAVVAWFGWQYGQVRKIDGSPYVRAKTFDETFFDFARAIVPSHNQFNYRLGNGDDNGTLASWLNIEYPYTPQTRDYYFQGVVNKDYYAQKDVEIWHRNSNYEETNFLLDWWGVQQFLVSRQGDVKGKFENRAEYLPLGGSLSDEAYLFTGASPVVSATDTAAVLVIGGGYDSVFRGLARGNINSQEIIPVHGSVFVDDYNSQELRQFKIILLYNYKFHSRKKAQKLLSSYVQDGGRLMIESNINEESGDKLFDPFPIDSAERGEVSGQWNFTKAGSDYDDIDFGNFGPAEFNGGPWGASFAGGLKSWAKTVIFADKKPIVVTGDYGKGQVVWSGLNLPFHINLYDSSLEARFLSRMLIGKELLLPNYGGGQVKASDAYQTKDYHIYQDAIAKIKNQDSRVFDGDGYKVEFDNPQNQSLLLSKPFSGVLFKEFFTPNIRVYKMSGKNRIRLPIYKAGPDFIYVALSSAKAGDKILFKYSSSLWEKGLLAVSMGTFIVLVVQFCDLKVINMNIGKLKKIVYVPLNTLSGWWGKED